MMIGRVLEKYEILEEVGQGGMSVVYRGLDQSLGRTVAIKVLHPHLAAIPEAKSRLEREAKAVAKLRHDNILEIYDYSGSASTESYIVTEFIKGHTLREFIEKHPIGYPEIAAMIVAQVAGALVHAHGLGVIHRDVKPENLMIRDDGVLKLMDFGIAQVVDTRRMTVTGQILGSPAYMAPEHVEGRPLDYRSDVFSLGVVLYQLSTGELPFKGKNAHEILKRIADGRYLDPRVASIKVGNRLGAIIDRALARDPEERYPDMRRFEDDLTAYLHESGLEDAPKELRRYLSDPASYEAAFGPRLIAALTKRGHEARAARKHARALELWNRVLTLEPDNAEVLTAIGELDRTRRWGKVAAGIGALALVAGGSVAVIWMAGRAGPGDTAPALATGGSAGESSGGVDGDGALPRVLAPASPTPDSAMAMESRDAATLVALTVDAGRKGPRETPGPSPTPTREPSTSPSASPRIAAIRRVELNPFPRAAMIILDGTEVGWYGPATRILELGPGKHEIRFTNPNCFDGVEIVEANEAPERIGIRLKWKPATLTVSSDTGTDVEIDGRPRGRPGEPISVQIPLMPKEGVPEGTTVVTVRVSAEGRESQSRDVTLQANQAKDVTINLPET